MRDTTRSLRMMGSLALREYERELLDDIINAPDEIRDFVIAHSTFLAWKLVRAGVWSEEDATLMLADAIAWDSGVVRPS